MTQLRQRMIGDMKLRSFAETTIHTYTRVVQDFAGFFHRAPDRLGPEQVRQYLLHSIDDKKLAWSTYQIHRAALKFIYTKTLKRPWFDLEIPKPKVRRKLPEVLCQEDIAKALNATMNLKHRAILATLYGSRCQTAMVNGWSFMFEKARAGYRETSRCLRSFWNFCAYIGAGASRKAGSFLPRATRSGPWISRAFTQSVRAPRKEQSCTEG